MKIVQLTTDSREHFKDYDGPSPYFGAAPEALLEGFAEMPEVEVHVVSCLRQPVASPSKLAENIFYHSLTVGKLGWLRTAYAGCVLKTRRLISDISPDLVHGQGTEKDCALSAIYNGFPNVVTIHGNMTELHRLNMHGHSLFGAVTSRLETHTLRRAGGVFCNSEYTEQLVLPRARRTWRVPNPIRSAFFQAPASAPSSGTPCLLNVGLVNPRKRQLEILQRVRKLKRNGCDLKIIFVGGLSESTEYGKRFTEELITAEKEGVAEFAGFLNAEELISLMDRCSGFVHFPTEEAFGLVVAEAMARGLKFFGADLGGIRDIVSGIPSAETFGDFEGLEQGIRNWLDAGAPRHPEATCEVKKRYHPTVIARKHLEIYSDLIGI